MNYTLLSARYANADHTSAVVETLEAGAIAISQADTPELWAQMLEQLPPEPHIQVPPDWRTPMDTDLTARRDRLMTVCDGLYNDYNERLEVEHRKLAYHFKQRLKDVTPKHANVLATTSAAEYKAATMALYQQAIAGAVLDTWPEDPTHAIPIEVKTEFKRYAA